MSGTKSTYSEIDVGRQHRDGVRVAQDVGELVGLVAGVDEQRAGAEQRAAEEGVDEVGQFGIRTATMSPRPTPCAWQRPRDPLARPRTSRRRSPASPGRRRRRARAAGQRCARARRRSSSRRSSPRSPDAAPRRAALTRRPAGPGCPRGRRTRARRCDPPPPRWRREARSAHAASRARGRRRGAPA